MDSDGLLKQIPSGNEVTGLDQAVRALGHCLRVAGLILHRLEKRTGRLFLATQGL